STSTFSLCLYLAFRIAYFFPWGPSEICFGMPKRQKRYFQLCVLSIRLGGSFQVSLRWHPVCELCARFGIPGIERLTHGPSVGRRVPCERNSMTLKVD